jgi:uncharacterized oxidoreductase
LNLRPSGYEPDELPGREAKEAMPLDQFIAETMAVFGTDADEVLVEGAKAFRANVGPNEHGLVNAFNEHMSAVLAGG